MKPIDPVTLAKEFSIVLKEWLGPELDEAVKLNDDEYDPRICHTHDFCDANMAMAEALERLGVSEIDMDGNDDAFCLLWNQSWAIAVKARFDPTQLPVPTKG